MEMPDLSAFLYPAIIAVLLWLFYAFGLRDKIIGSSNSKHAPPETIEHSTSKKAKTTGVPEKKSARKHLKSESNYSKSTVNQFSHPWLAATLKAHTDSVQNLHMSSNGNMLASCASDRTVHIWSTKDFVERDHKQIRVNIEFDSASRVHWSPDNKAFLIAKAEEKSIEVFKLGKKPDGSIGNVTKSPLKYSTVHEDSIVGLGIACSGKFMMTCSGSSHLAIWDLKGNLLDEMIISNGMTFSAKVSLCGRFVGVAGEYDSPSNLIIREVTFKDDKYVGIGAPFMGGDHKIPVYAFDFNTDSSKIVSLDNQGTWKLFDTSGNRMDVVRKGTLKLINATANKPVISLSHDGRVILVGTGTNIEIYSAITGLSLLLIENCHNEPVRDIQFSFDDTFFVTCGDRVINVFHNICGYQETIRDLRSQLSDKSLSQALKTRLSKQVTALETKLSYLNV